jgi:hypothetical protein
MTDDHGRTKRDTEFLYNAASSHLKAHHFKFSTLTSSSRICPSTLEFHIKWSLDAEVGKPLGLQKLIWTHLSDHAIVGADYVKSMTMALGNDRRHLQIFRADLTSS